MISRNFPLQNLSQAPSRATARAKPRVGSRPAKACSAAGSNFSETDKVWEKRVKDRYGVKGWHDVHVWMRGTEPWGDSVRRTLIALELRAPALPCDGGQRPLHVISGRYHLPRREKFAFALTGCDVNAADDSGLTPLDLACKERGNLCCVPWLLEAHAKVKPHHLASVCAHRLNYDYGEEAAKSEQMAAIEALLQHGASLSSSVDGWSALNMAEYRGYSWLVDRLLDFGVDVNSFGPNGENIAHAVVRASHLPRVAWLLEHGVDITRRNIDGNTPLMLAAKLDRRIYDAIRESWPPGDISRAMA